MTYPRPVPPGRVVMIQRRVTRRHFVLRPDANRKMQRIFLYILARYANQYGIAVHAPVVMSDHEHIVLTDVRGELPNFLRDFHRELARATKAHRKWDEEVFNKSQTSVVELPTTRSMIKKIAYVLANPVEAGAVERYDRWPGVTVSVEDLGARTLTIAKPKLSYFDGPTWPAWVQLPITLPDALIEEHRPARAREAIADEIERLSVAKRAELKRQGRRFLGATRCCATPISQQAATREPIVDRNPTFADAGDREVFFAKLAELREWRAAYAQSLDAWRRGDRASTFPAHTWSMRVVHDAAVAA